jgi:hypothetical protein
MPGGAGWSRHEDEDEDSDYEEPILCTKRHPLEMEHTEAQIAADLARRMKKAYHDDLRAAEGCGAAGRSQRGVRTCSPAETSFHVRGGRAIAALAMMSLPECKAEEGPEKAASRWPQKRTVVIKLGEFSSRIKQFSREKVNLNMNFLTARQSRHDVTTASVEVDDEAAAYREILVKFEQAVCGAATDRRGSLASSPSSATWSDMSTMSAIDSQSDQESVALCTRTEHSH